MSPQKRNIFAKLLSYLLQDNSIPEAIRKAFWLHPDRLMAAKATLVIAALAIPFVALNLPFVAVSLALGALAGALSETDDHPRGRIKALALKTFSFAATCLGVELLHGYPLFLGIGLAVSTIVFVLIGGLSERYRGVAFGSLLVGIYAMLGADISPDWRLQPILLPAGALAYGLFSLALLYARPWRLLEEQLGQGYLALSKYMDEKARLFPSKENEQEDIRSKLALLNVKVVGSLDRIKDAINSYSDAVKDDPGLKPYIHSFLRLQSLHERAASSHERYDILSREESNLELLEGMGQTLRQLAIAANKTAESLLTNTPYEHPAFPDWMLNNLKEQIRKLKLKKNHPLALLVQNLDQMNEALKSESPVVLELTARFQRDKRSIGQRLKEQLNLNHPRLRYAIRLSLCFLLGFAVSEYFSLPKGEWIVLTILFVLQPTYSATRRRLFQRILGTVAGVVAGILIAKLFTFPGQLALMIVSAFLFFFWLKKLYSVAVIFITIFVLCAFNLIAASGVALMLPRLLDSLIGASLAIVTVRLLWPDWQYKKLPGLLADALQKNALYFEVIVNEYENPASGDDLDFRIARREAHRADNALVLAWQDMQVEPKKYRAFRKQAFALTYLNHALLSYLSAFAAHRNAQRTKFENLSVHFHRISLSLKEAIEELNANRQKESNLDKASKAKIETEKSTVEKSPNQTHSALTNIQEVTLQLLREAKNFSSKSV